jgi:quercetin dioxygenase-like cupin family protein
MFRPLSIAAALSLASGFSGDARQSAPVVVKEIVKTMKNDAGQAITLPRGRLQLIVSTYEIAPGARLPQHKHQFQRYAYVIQGRLLVEQIGSSSRIYHAGEFIAESVNRWHFGETVGPTPVKLLVIDQLPPGRKATVLRAPGDDGPGNAKALGPSQARRSFHISKADSQFFGFILNDKGRYVHWKVGA